MAKNFKNLKESKPTIKFDGLKFVLEPNRICIAKGALNVMTSKRMRAVLDTLQKEIVNANITMSTPFDNRTISSMVDEWLAHNYTAVLGRQYSTPDQVVFESNQKWYRKVYNWVVSRVTSLIIFIF